MQIENVLEVEAGTGGLGGIQRALRDRVTTDKVHLEWNLTRDMKTRRIFYTYIHSKRKPRENVGTLFNGNGDLVPKKTEKAEVHNASFASLRC